ncbi:hypothetical protein O0L34_g15485 [Tuta absoluta]|nr:hypothetical protein O0L34_g15485 [Tuta absoluta]
MSSRESLHLSRSCTHRENICVSAVADMSSRESLHLSRSCTHRENICVSAVADMSSRESLHLSRSCTHSPGEYLRVGGGGHEQQGVAALVSLVHSLTGRISACRRWRT